METNLTQLLVADLERIVQHQGEQIAVLAAKVSMLENPSAQVEWMSFNAAAAHSSLKGRLSAKQIRDRVLQSIADPVTGVFVANQHYQVFSSGSTTRYVVNAIAISQWLKKSTDNIY